MSRLALLLKLIGKPALLLVGLTGGALALRFLPFDAVLKAHHATGFQDELRDAALFVLAGALACAVGMPRQIVAFAAGYAWGLAPGAGLALLAQVIGCALDLFWARMVARDFVRARLHGRMAQLDMRLTRRPFLAALILRLMPIGNNLLLNLLAGVSAVSATGFLAGSAIGFVPQTVIFVLLGSGSRIARGTQIELGILLFVVSTLLGLLLLKRSRSTGTQQPVMISSILK